MNFSVEGPLVFHHFFISSQKKARALEYKFIFDKFMFEVNVIGEKIRKN